MAGPGEAERPDSTGFAFTRRWLLRTGAAGIAAATAGCRHDEEGGSTPSSTATPEPTPTRTEPPDEQVEAPGLVDDGLTVVKSELVENPQLEALQPELDRPIKTERYIRVLVRNDLDKGTGVVTLSVDLFDDRMRFLEVQVATISSLRSGEVFEGYVPFFTEASSRYLIRARRSRRRSVPEQLDGVSLVDHCLGDERVHGTVRNDGSSTVDRLRVQVRFIGPDGTALGTGRDTLYALESAESRRFDVYFDAVLDEASTSVVDYTIEVGDYGAGPRAIR